MSAKGVMVVYKTTNQINGKFYVGKDTKNNPEYLGSGLILLKAIKKYGRYNFIKEILQVCETQEQLNAAEIYWIEKLDATNLGYNIATGGKGGKTTENVWNKGLTKETDERVKLNGLATGKALKGRVQSEKQKAKRAKSLTGLRRTEETKNKQSRALKEFHANRGRFPEETKLKISETLKRSHPASITTLQCLICGKEFQRRECREKSRIKENKNGPYCSKSCLLKGVVRVISFVKLTCLFCKHEFEKKASREKERIKRGMVGPFCDPLCANRYRSEKMRGES
jgi:group I intron endonuclease